MKKISNVKEYCDYYLRKAIVRLDSINQNSSLVTLIYDYRIHINALSKINRIFTGSVFEHHRNQKYQKLISELYFFNDTSKGKKHFLSSLNFMIREMKTYEHKQKESEK